MKTTNIILNNLTNEQLEDLVCRYKLQIKQTTKRIEEAQTIIKSRQALHFGLQAKTLANEQVEDLIWRYELQIRQATKRMEEAQTIVESKQALRFGLQAKTKLLALNS